jgi:hypothetical protein
VEIATDLPEDLGFFIDDAQGARGLISVWANQKYHGHRTLLPKILNKLKNEFQKTHKTKIKIKYYLSYTFLHFFFFFFFFKPNILRLLALM